MCGFGKVVRAWNDVKKRMVALKILPKEKIIDFDRSRQVIKERDVLKHLSAIKRTWDADKSEWKEEYGRHFIMNMYKSFQDDENVYFELEYIKGCTLLS